MSVFFNDLADSNQSSSLAATFHKYEGENIVLMRSECVRQKGAVSHRLCSHPQEVASSSSTAVL